MYIEFEMIVEDIQNSVSTVETKKVALDPKCVPGIIERTKLYTLSGYREPQPVTTLVLSTGMQVNVVGTYKFVKDEIEMVR
jgi:hypothetical protein